MENISPYNVETIVEYHFGSIWDHLLSWEVVEKVKDFGATIYKKGIIYIAKENLLLKNNKIRAHSAGDNYKKITY